MKHYIGIILFIVMILLIGLSADAGVPTPAEDSIKFARDTASAVSQDRRDLKIRLEKARIRVNNEIDRLHAAAVTADDSSKNRIDDKINHLNSIKDDLSDRIDRIGTTGNNGWKSFWTSSDRAIRNADNNLNNAKSVIKEKGSK